MYCFSHHAHRPIVKNLGVYQETCYFVLQCIIICESDSKKLNVKWCILTQLELGMIPSKPFSFCLTADSVIHDSVKQSPLYYFNIASLNGSRPKSPLVHVV